MNNDVKLFVVADLIPELTRMFAIHEKIARASTDVANPIPQTLYTGHESLGALKAITEIQQYLLNRTKEDAQVNRNYN